MPEEVKNLWNECQKVRTEKIRSGHPSPRSRQHRVYPLTGVLVCDGCGRPFHGVSTISKPRSYPRMTHSGHRCDMRPLSVSAPMVEKEFVERVLGQIKLDDGWQQAVLRAMTNEGPQPDCSLEVKRIEVAMANLRKQHLWGFITDEEFRTEHVSLERQKRALEASRTPLMAPNLDRAAQLLSHLPALWQHPCVSPEQRRELAGEIFEEIRLKEGRLAAVKPRPEYAPLFAYSIWRYNVVTGDQSP